MGVVPDTKLARVQFYENHNAPWTANAGAIGLLSGDVTTIRSKTATARAAYNAQQAAQDAAKASTHAFKTAVDDMQSFGAELIKKIKVKAATDGPSVYDLAMIPAPATPTPMPPPGRPSDFVAELDETGALTLKWKCVNPSGSQGTTYQVFRKAGGSDAPGDFLFIGATGLKSFPDTTLPSGNAAVTYRVVAVRSTSTGPAGQFTVNFGVSGGEMTASVSAPKLAA
jgi:hypothetical protein